MSGSFPPANPSSPPAAATTDWGVPLLPFVSTAAAAAAAAAAIASSMSFGAAASFLASSSSSSSFFGSLGGGTSHASHVSASKPPAGLGAFPAVMRSLFRLRTLTNRASLRCATGPNSLNSSTISAQFSTPSTGTLCAPSVSAIISRTSCL